MLIKCAVMDTNDYNGIKCTTGVMNKVHCSSAESMIQYFWCISRKKGSQGKGIKLSAIQAKY